MKLTANREGNGGGNQMAGVKILSAFQLDGSCYGLVEEATVEALPYTTLAPGTDNVGSCAIHGKTYRILQLSTGPDTPQTLAEMLTERELDIAMLVALGWANKQIADKLHISEWTVSTHLRRIFAKLGVHSRAAMVYRCMPLLGGNAHGEVSGWSHCVPP